MLASRRILTTLAVGVGMLGGATGGAAQSGDPTDPEIAHIAVTANALDVEAARLALERSGDSAVREFAQTMIRDHEGVIEQATRLAARLEVTPRDNDTSRGLTAEAETKLKELSALDGDSFDRAYAENEVAYHEAVVSAVRSTLIPATENEELRSLLEAVLPVLESHLAHARRLAADTGSDL